MANDLNRICLIGRLGKDAELVDSKSGKQYMKFSLATNRKKGGEEVTEWHNITVWNEDENSIIPFIEVSYGHNIQLLGSKNDEQVEPKQSGQDESVFGKPAVRGKPDTDTDSGVPW
jgi:hypothetical protein